ncbi:hypothetical protein PV325_007129 [Microctonus aethiopoides]|nr:hypothetical protein PV325_007129 [Microctonus aethiopoides]
MLKLTFLTVVIELPLNPVDLISNIECGPTNLEASRDSITFHLFTRSNRETAYILKIDDVDNLKASPFSGTRPTKYILHGWGGNAGLPWIVKMCQSYLDVDDYNVIIVDYSPVSRLEYTTATRYAPSVGKIIGQMLKFLNTEGSMSFSDVHMVGHSLGAHVSGFAGAAVFGDIDRITGVDPASPCFGFPVLKRAEDRLDPTDAIFVDIIHTDEGVYGMRQICGHADFFPNGGDAPQPGCTGIDQNRCSHKKSTEYTIESINIPQRFPAFQCDSWNNYKDGNCANNPVAYMGNACDPSARGKYYLTTE